MRVIVKCQNVMRNCFLGYKMIFACIITHQKLAYVEHPLCALLSTKFRPKKAIQVSSLENTPMPKGKTLSLFIYKDVACVNLFAYTGI